MVIGSVGEGHEVASKTDVNLIVVGAGMAGACAALSAAESGASVLVLEKENRPGGSAALSAGLMAFAGTEEQAAQGIEDSPELLGRDLLRVSRNKASAELVQAYCEEQLATYYWLKGRGARFGRVHAASGQSVPRSHPTDAAALVDELLSMAKDLGVRVFYGTPVRELIRAGNTVVGVEYEEEDGARRRVLSNCVLLATGGFSRNEALLERFAPSMGGALRGGAAGSTGDGLLMACELGAGVVDTPYIKATFGIHPWGKDETGIMAIYKGAIAINASGDRFVDESRPYKEIGDACLAQEAAGAYQIFDAQVMRQSDPSVPIYDFASRLRRGMILEAGSLTALARKVDVVPSRLKATVARYNSSVRAGGRDAFGRRNLSGEVGELFPIDEPPYYAFPTTAVVLATYCGLTVDAMGRVLDVYGVPVSGLLAAGEIVGGFHGDGYMTGSSLGKSAVFGRTSVKDIPVA